jgi:hypothetical protein
MSVAIHTVVLVEGTSDQRAVEALAQRRGRNLGLEGVSVVPMGGATNIRAFLERFGPNGFDLKLSGLCDAGEEDVFRRGLEHAGIGTSLDRSAMASLGFHVCIADLEDELIRCLGVDRVERVVDEAGELGSFRTLQKQAAQRDRSAEAQLRRFMGSKGGRKIRYAQLLVDALDPARVPDPLNRLLAFIQLP